VRQDAWKCGSATASSRTRPIRSSPTARSSPGRPARPADRDLWWRKRRRLRQQLERARAPAGWPRPSRSARCKRNEALLRLIRARLHLVASRREDRLVFDLQTAVAQ
jgi:[protein-PII] uridylyltransferase